LKKLFLIDGAAGTGKSDLLEFIQTKHKSNSSAISKFTTRPERDVEEAKKHDLTFISDNSFENIEKQSHSSTCEKLYQYYYGGYNYGFLKSQLDYSLANYENTFAIVRSYKLIKVSQYHTLGQTEYQVSNYFV